MTDYITKKSDKDKKEDKKEKPEYIKKKIHYIKKKVTQPDLTEHRADIEKAVSEGVGSSTKTNWITRKNSKTNPARPQGGWKD